LKKRGRPLGVSERQLRKLFKKEMGVSIRDYRANFQLNRAISLMRNPKLALGRVAELSGFRSQAVFNRFVKRQTGLTPKQLRESALGEPVG
jgi:AraC-type DNA-binding domain-containing proteins